MRSLLTVLLISSIAFHSFAQNDAPITKEDKSSFIVNVNGEEHTIAQGEDLNLDGSVEATVISVRLADFKKLNTGSISFDYPSHFAFEFEESYGYRNWTLDGNNVVVLYFEFDLDTELTDFVDEMVGQFGKKNCKVEDKAMKIGKKTLNGKRINVTLVGQSLTLDFVEINLGDNKSRFIAFQDALNDYGGASDEVKAAIEMISETIKY